MTSTLKKFGLAMAASLALAACGSGGGGDDTSIPVLSAQPASQAVRAASSVSFVVSASGVGLSYRWQLSVDAGLVWTDIEGAVLAQYTITAPSVSMNGYRYRAVVTSSAGGSVTTAPATLAVTPEHAVGEVFRDCTDICPEMVALPSGNFQMGVRAATDVFREQSSPVHAVAIAHSLAVGRTEVTRAEFARFVQATAYRTDAEGGAGCLVSNPTGTGLRADANWRAPGFSQTDTDPVVCTSWNDAQAYVAWLNMSVPGKGFRLLTEAEWEYAARAGQANTRYPWGDDLTYQTICTYANSGDLSATASVPRFAQTRWTNCADGYGYTASADAYPANAFGLRNLIGNAWEWVQDGWHSTYAGAPADGGAWALPVGETSRVYRGGSWSNHPTYLDPAYRARALPTYADEATGFRVARTL